jgi:hypothetical protein
LSRCEIEIADVMLPVCRVGRTEWGGRKPAKPNTPSGQAGRDIALAI